MVCGQVVAEEPLDAVGTSSPAPVELEWSVEYEASRLCVVPAFEPITVEVPEIHDKSDVYSA